MTIITIKYNSILLFAVVISSLFFSCTHEPDDIEPPIGDTCIYYPDGWWGDVTIQWQYRSFDFYAPCFNPNNDNEFIYIRRNSDLSIIELRKHNIATGTDILLTALSGYNYMLTWSQNGWIIINNTTYVLWKVQDNGQNFMQFTSQNAYRNPSINTSGTLILAEQLGSPNRNVLLDLSGSVIDTVTSSAYTVWSWINDSIFINIRSEDDFFQIISYSPNNMDTIYQGFMPYTPSFGINEYSDMSVFASSVGGGVYLYNYLDESMTYIRERFGDKHIYLGFSLSPNKDKILIERLTQIRIDSINNIYSSCRNIVLMNIDGTNEQVIELPQ